MMERRAKIVCTLGPSSSTPELIDNLVGAGMDVARLNFSHGTPEEHAARVAAVRRASGHYEKSVACHRRFAGTKNSHRLSRARRSRPTALRPEIHDHHAKKSPAPPKASAPPFASSRIPFTKAIESLLSDGNIALRVLSTRGRKVICQVENGGELREHQGINLPGVKLKIPSLTPKDRTRPRFCSHARRELRGAKFCAHRARRSRRQGRDSPRRQGYSRHRQARKTGSHRQSRRNSCRRRLRDGRARRSRRRDEPGKSSRRAEANHHAGARRARSRDHCHANARFHAGKSAAHARRSFRRCQRDLRRQRRPHALRRNGRRTLPARIRADDGSHHSRSRSQRHTNRCAPRAPAILLISETIAEAICHAAEELTHEGHRRLHGNRRLRAARLQIPSARCPSSLFRRIRILAAK